MGKSTPKAPDPMQTAQAQAQMNQQTATTQQQLNMVDQVTPDGSLNYTSGGTWPDGTPKYTATTSLSPTQQGIYNTNQVTQGNLAQIGADQSAKIGSILGTPFKLGNEETEGRLMDLGMSRLQPQFDRNSEALKTQLYNSGIREGSDAWNTEMTRNSQSQNDAITQLLLNGRQLSDQELLTERNQPINEVSALLSGAQVSNPTFTSTPQSQVGGVNYTGLVGDNYKAQVAQSNAAMGGMFGLGGTLAGGVMKYGLNPMNWSDRRLKTDISIVGKLDNGLKVYLFRYTAGGPPMIGLMADDVEHIHPEAVHEINGYKMVDYTKAVEAA